MLVDAFHYELPQALIAQRPTEAREGARLLHLPADGGAPEHRVVADLGELLPPAGLLVINDTRVVPARLLGRKRETGGQAEVLLVERAADRTIDGIEATREVQVWRALTRSHRPIRAGAEVAIAARAEPSPTAAPRLWARVLTEGARDGLREVALYAPDGESVDDARRACGHVPLPPYIEREDEADDGERYQTVYARHDGAIAAPTAGLHLTGALLDRLTARGWGVARVTLHVGLGTFQPVKAQDLDEHVMHAERYSVEPAVVAAVDEARRRGVPVVAVGTTTVRALESAADLDRPGHVREEQGETRLLIQPGHAWRVVDGLLTNFHLPRSTLLALVCAFGGTEKVLAAYRLAVAERYRFFSYGDAMLLWRSR